MFERCVERMDDLRMLTLMLRHLLGVAADMTIIVLGRAACQIRVRNVLRRLDFRIVEQTGADVDDTIADGIILGQLVCDRTAALLNDGQRSFLFHTSDIRNGDKNIRVIPTGERRLAFRFHCIVKCV